jgi:2-iminobutanoate/2-iminopropanoate deaminase
MARGGAMNITSFDMPNRRLPGFSDVVAAGAWILISGQIAFAEGKLVGIGQAETQARQCFQNIAEALALTGAGLADIVKLTCFMTDAAAYPAYAAVKAELFPDRPPTGTAVVVAGLLVPGALFEVEALAFRSNRDVA